MEHLWDLYNYFVGVSINVDREVLVIEDRRPSWAIVVSVPCFMIVTVLAIWLWWQGILFALGILTYIFIPASLVACMYFVLTSSFRELYVFDKGHDVYSLQRQSLINRRDVVDGSLSQLTGVAVLRQDADDSYLYSVALTMGGMLLGQSGTQVLRERQPMFSSHGDTESSIANAIASHLNIPRTDAVDVESDDLITLGL